MSFPVAEKLYPLKFEPIYMERVWGGTQITEVLGRTLPEHKDPVGESWELCDREEVQSVVANGPLAGKTIGELMQQYRTDLAGFRAANVKRFPLLIKLIDAGEKLSLQVHPDAAACRKLGNGAESKTEMWYILSCRPGANILAGLTGRFSRPQISDKLVSGDLDGVLQVHSSQVGDAYYIASGTVHAIGAGNLILEIQQNSDTTYRISDWGRLGSDGKPRTLHIQEGLSSIDFTARISPRIPANVERVSRNRKTPLVSNCPYFNITEINLVERREDNTRGESFHYISAARGCVMVGRGEDMVKLLPGESVLIPAAFGAYNVYPEAENECCTVIKTTL